MALFGKKKTKESEIDPEVERRNQAWAKLDHHLGHNPLFALRTFDRLNWIEPFTGEIIPAPFDLTETARQHFAQSEHWMRAQTKSAGELQAIQWFHWIRHHIRQDDRLRIFDPHGRWMNPRSGTFSDEARRQGGKVDGTTLSAMARELVAAGARSPEDLKSLAELQELLDLPGSDDDSGVAPIIGDGDFDAGRGVAVESTDNFRAPSAERKARRISSGRLPVAEGSDHGLGALRKLYQDLGSEQSKETNEDLERARQVQQKMLPDIPQIPGYDIAVRYDPYDAIGGDLYEIVRLDERRYLILLGDVTGHGVQAALVTSSMIKALRYIVRQEKDLVEILCALNDNAKEDLLSGQFVTVWAGILDVVDHRLEAVCAGHHQALRGNPRKNLLIERISNKGIAIGLVGSAMLRRQLKTATCQLEPGDVLLQYTDGLNEMMNAARVEYGELRVIGSMVCHLDRSLPEMIDGMVDMAKAYACADPDDDVTLLALRLRPADEGEDDAAGAG